MRKRTLRSFDDPNQPRHGKQVYSSPGSPVHTPSKRRNMILQWGREVARRTVKSHLTHTA